MTWNQIFANIHCNSEAYNVIYDINQLVSDISGQIIPVINQYIVPNMTFFSNMLKIDLSGSVTNNNHTMGYQSNRRNLEINPYIIVDPNLTYICLILQYKYLFDYVSRRTRFKKNKRAIVGNVNYKCKDILPNYTYVLGNSQVSVTAFYVSQSEHGQRPTLPGGVSPEPGLVGTGDGGTAVSGIQPGYPTICAASAFS